MRDDSVSDQLSDYLAKIGRKGGQARAKAVTPEQRKASATKASKAAAERRMKRAENKRHQH